MFTVRIHVSVSTYNFDVSGKSTKYMMEKEAGCGRNNLSFITDRHSSTCSPQRPIQLRATFSLFFSGYERHFTGVKGGRNAKLNVHVQLTAWYFGTGTSSVFSTSSHKKLHIYLDPYSGYSEVSFMLSKYSLNDQNSGEVFLARTSGEREHRGKFSDRRKQILLIGIKDRN